MTTATVRAPGLAATLASEWSKLKSVRSTWAVPGVAALISIGFSVLFSYLTESSYESLPADQRTNFDAVGTSLVGVNLGMILFSVLGVLIAASEYSSGMIRLTLTITPNRSRVFLAKALLIGVLSFVLGALFATVSFLVGQAILGMKADIPTLGLGGPGVLRSLLGWGAVMTAFALVAMSLGVLLRSAAGAIAAAIALIFAPAIFGQFLPVWAQRDIVAHLPNAAADHLSSAQLDTASPTYTSPLVAGGVLAAWVAVFLVAALSVMNKRDSG